MLLTGKLLLLALLVGFELLVLVWAAQPRISEAYRRRFVDRTSACWSPPGFERLVARRPQPNVIEPTQLDEATSCVYFPDGWGLDDEGGIWTIAPHAQLRLPAAGRRVRLWFRAPGFRPLPQQFAIHQAGSLLAAGQLAPKELRSFDFIPAHATADRSGFVTLDLTIAHPARPRDWQWQRNDKRLLGLLLTRVEIGEPSAMRSSRPDDR
jgi:hypothetical protein